MQERIALVRFICDQMTEIGLAPDEFVDLRERLEKTSVEVLRDIVGTNAVSEAYRKTREVAA